MGNGRFRRLLLRAAHNDYPSHHGPRYASDRQLSQNLMPDPHSLASDQCHRKSQRPNGARFANDQPAFSRTSAGTPRTSAAVANCATTCTSIGTLLSRNSYIRAIPKVSGETARMAVFTGPPVY